MPTKHTFASRTRQHRIKKTEGGYITDPTGRILGTREPEWIEFKNGIYVTESQAEADLIRQRIETQGDVWELGAHANATPVDELLGRVTQLIFEGDEGVENIRKILREERDGPGRDPVIEACLNALKGLNRSENSPGRPKGK